MRSLVAKQPRHDFGVWDNISRRRAEWAHPDMIVDSRSDTTRFRRPPIERLVQSGGVFLLLSQDSRLTLAELPPLLDAVRTSV
jgi:hypothetical protein